MVAEMTGGFAVLPGGILAVALAYLLVRHWDVSIYSKQRYDRATAGRRAND